MPTLAIIVVGACNNTAQHGDLLYSGYRSNSQTEGLANLEIKAIEHGISDRNIVACKIVVVSEMISAIGSGVEVESDEFEANITMFWYLDDGSEIRLPISFNGRSRLVTILGHSRALDQVIYVKYDGEWNMVESE